MKYINLTPHAVHLLTPANTTFDPKSKKFFLDEGTEPEVIESYEASGIVPRCKQEEKVVKKIVVNGHEVKVVKMVFGEVQDLPDPTEDTAYIVGSMIATACPERNDLVIPSHQVIRKNADGTTTIVGCLDWGTAASDELAVVEVIN